MVLCVTGPMAAGKNAASDILEKKGFVSIDADIAVHTAIDNSRDKILEAFGSIAQEKNISLLTPESRINRRALGQIVFSSPSLIAQQERIVYPETNRLLEQFMQDNKEKDIIINATVLYKIPLISKMDTILYIDAPSLLRFFRALKRDKISCRNILSRFKMQRNLFAKYKNANADTRRVWNIGTREQLEKKINKFLAECHLRG